jgi:hypothetical protein
MNGGAVEGVDVARQHQLSRLSAPLQLNHRDRRNGLLLRPLLQLLVVVATSGDSAVGDGDRGHCKEEDRPPRLDRPAILQIGSGRLGVRGAGLRLRRVALSWPLTASSVRLRSILAHAGVALAGRLGAGSLARLGLRS